MQVLSTYCGCLYIGTYAVMSKLADKFDDKDKELYEEKLLLSQKNIKKLWNGKYYTCSELGKYKNSTMSDALFDIMLASKVRFTD